jgi:hypothetical protein
MWRNCNGLNKNHHNIKNHQEVPTHRDRAIGKEETKGKATRGKLEQSCRVFRSSNRIPESFRSASSYRRTKLPNGIFGHDNDELKRFCDCWSHSPLLVTKGQRSEPVDVSSFSNSLEFSKMFSCGSSGPCVTIIGLSGPAVDQMKIRKNSLSLARPTPGISRHS